MEINNNEIEQVHIWLIPVQEVADRLPEFYRILDEEEIGKAGNYYFGQDRIRYVVAHGALRVILGGYLEIPPETVQYDRLPGGKPILSPDLRSDLVFNMSHSEDIVQVGISQDGQLEIGVDVEWVRSESFPLEIAERYFSPGEIAYLNALPIAAQRTGFFRIWTRKEAYIKGLGAGLALELTSFDVSQQIGVNSVTLNEESDPAREEKWKIVDLDLGPEYAGAVAGLGLDWGLRSYRFEGDMIREQILKKL